jgi:hypothetical protein
MLNLRYDIQWVGRANYTDEHGGIHDKIWGWFVRTAPNSSENNKNSSAAYVFWAPTGKPPKFSKHPNSYYRMKKLVNQKIKRKYKKIDTAALLKIWPSFYDDIDSRFVFFMLVGD